LKATLPTINETKPQTESAGTSRVCSPSQAAGKLASSALAIPEACKHADAGVIDVCRFRSPEHYSWERR
jgi:hypothetical protein